MGTQLFVGCSKCGHPMPVEEQAVKNAIALGQEFVAAHDVCPGEVVADKPEVVLRRFRAQIVVCEIPVDEDGDVVVPAPRLNDVPLEMIAGTGKTVEAVGPGEALSGPLTVWLNEVWETLASNAAIADVPVSTPTSGD